jgi:hypothetical protein
VSILRLVSLPMLISCRVAVVFAIQSWLAESPEQKRTSTTPAYFQVGMSGTSKLKTWRVLLTIVQPCRSSL